MDWYDPAHSLFLEPLSRDFKTWCVPQHHPLEGLYMLNNGPKINRNRVFHFKFVKKINDWVSFACGYSSVEVTNWAIVIKSWLKTPVVYTKSTHEGLAVFGESKNEFFLIPWFETLTCENIQNENEMQELARSMELSTPTPQNNTKNSPVNTIINELEEHLGLSPSQKTDACLNNILLTALAAEKSAP